MADITTTKQSVPVKLKDLGDGTYAPASVECYAPGYEDNVNNVAKVEQRFSYTAISSATTTTVKSGGGFLHRLVITGGTAGTIDVYDNTAGSGTKIASFSSTNALASYEFNCSFANGLTIVTSAATNVTAVWR